MLFSLQVIMFIIKTTEFSGQTIASFHHQTSLPGFCNVKLTDNAVAQGQDESLW